MDLRRTDDSCTGLKICVETLHENAISRNALILSVLASSCSASGCSTMQRYEADPAFDPAHGIRPAAARQVSRCHAGVKPSGKSVGMFPYWAAASPRATASPSGIFDVE